MHSELAECKISETGEQQLGFTISPPVILRELLCSGGQVIWDRLLCSAQASDTQ